MFLPHVTVACVVHCKDKFLFVEEEVDGVMTLNQPAGHLEANESLLDAMHRELWEETGIRAEVDSLLKVYQWKAPDGTPFVRFNYVLSLNECLPTTPHDSDITRCLWLNETEFQHYIQQPQQKARSPLVQQCLNDFHDSNGYPLDMFRFYS